MKVKKVIATILALSFCSAFAACGEQTEAEAALEAKKKSIGRLTPVTVNDFEDPSSFAGIHTGMSNELALDTQTAKSGKQSLKLIRRAGKTSTNVSFIQDLDVQGGESHASLTLVTMIGYWVYNPSDTAQNVYCTLTFAEDMSSKYTGVAEANGWTHVTHEIKREMLPSLTCNTITVAAATPDPNVEYEYNIDDITFYQSARGAERVTIPREEHDICSFDWNSQISGCSFYNGGSTDVVTTVEKSSFTKDGTGTSLHIMTTATDDDGGDIWPLVYLDLKTIWSFPYAYYDDNDELVFEYFIPENSGITNMWINLRTSDYNRYFKPMFTKGICGQWVTYRVTVKEMRGASSKESTFDKTTHLYFAWQGKQSNNEEGKIYEAYIDNIRMEVNPNG